MNNITDDQLNNRPLGTMLFSVEARFVKLDRLGLVPEGERVNAHFLGDVTGMLGQGKIRGIDYSLKRPDGVVAIHVHEVFTSNENYMIAIERQGIGTPEGETMLSLSGTGWARTAQENQAWLNDSPLVWRGSVNKETGSLSLRIYAVRAEQNAAGAQTVEG